MQKLYNILFFVTSVISYGQVTVLTEVNSKEAKQNEPIVLTIVQEVVGENMEQQTPLRLPDLSKFNIIGNASEQNTFIDQKKGIRVNQIVYQFYLQPKTTGKVKIGSALLTVNGKIYKSEPFDIFVKEGDKRADNAEYLSKDVYLDLEVQDKDVYENQPTVAILRAYSKNYDNFRKLENIQFPRQNNASIKPINYKKQDIETNDGNFASQIIAMFIIFPEKSGNVEIEPVSALVKAPEINKIISNKVKLNVKTLPKKGCPENFKDAVGNFEISIENSNKHKHIEINKPTDVLVKITGLGNLDTKKLPKIITSDDYVFYPPKITSQLTTIKDGVKGEICAKYVVIPKKQGEINIKTEHFSFFNPQKNKYIDLGEKSLAITVLTPEQISDQKTTIDLVDDYTKNVLEKVPLPVIEREKHTQNYHLNWINLFAGLVTIFGGTILFYLFLRPKKSKLQTETAKPITTISDEEERLREKIKPDASAYLEYLNNLKNQNNYSEFFNVYNEFRAEVEKQIENSFGMGIKAYAENYKGAKTVEDLKNLERQISIEKYAPFHEKEQIENLYQSIVEIYADIAK